MNNITESAILLALSTIQGREGCVLTAYQDSNGIWTIGWGDTGPDVFQGVVWAQDFANQRLEQRVRTEFAPVVAKYITVQLTDHQNAALIDFCYNCGNYNFEHSTLLKDLDASNFADVPTQLERWVHGQNGVQLAGLVARRLLEANLFQTPDNPVSATAAVQSPDPDSTTD